MFARCCLCVRQLSGRPLIGAGSVAQMQEPQRGSLTSYLRLHGYVYEYAHVYIYI